MLQNGVSGYRKITFHQGDILHHAGVLSGAPAKIVISSLTNARLQIGVRRCYSFSKNLDTFTIIVLCLLYLFVLIKSAVVRLLFCSVKGIFYILCLYVTSWCYKTFATFHKHTCLLHEHERYFTEVFYLRINSHTPVR